MMMQPCPPPLLLPVTPFPVAPPPPVDGGRIRLPIKSKYYAFSPYLFYHMMVQASPPPLWAGGRIRILPSYSFLLPCHPLLWLARLLTSSSSFVPAYDVIQCYLFWICNVIGYEFLARLHLGSCTRIHTEKSISEFGKI